MDFLGDVAEALRFVVTPGNWTGETEKTAVTPIAEALWTHTWLSALALLVAAAIALPLALWLGHVGRGGVLAVNVSNAGRAVPTLALLFVLSLNPALFGEPAVVIALVAFALPPLVTNAYVGMREVDADTKEAAVGSGMTGWQLLRRVEIPLAAPLVLTGVRTATVQVIATTTLGALAGVGGLGSYITGGQGRQDQVLVYIGVVLVAAYAMAADLLLGVLQRRTEPTRREGGAEPGAVDGSAAGSGEVDDDAADAGGTTGPDGRRRDVLAAGR